MFRNQLLSRATFNFFLLKFELYLPAVDVWHNFISETGRNLTLQLTEHKQWTKNGDVNNHIAEHHLHTNHRIDWDSTECATYSKDYYKWLTLKSWFTN